MRGDKIIYNGEICDLTDCGLGLDCLLSGNYVYQSIHVSDFSALHLDEHMRITSEAHTVLYGCPIGLDPATVQSDITRLFKANLYRDLSYEVRLYAFEHGYAISCLRQLLYKGYVFWHSRPAAIITPYENPLSGYPNASSLISATLAAGFARRSSSGSTSSGSGSSSGSSEETIAITENYDHILVGAGDNPLFAVREDRVIVTPVKYGATRSVERSHGIRAAIEAGYNVAEAPLMRDDIAHFDELFMIDTQGIISIFRCGETTFFGQVAERISKFYK